MIELPLTEREKQMLRRMAKGLSDREIAADIGGRPHQVYAQRQRLLTKLQIGSRQALIEAAQRWASWSATKQRNKEVAGNALDARET